MSYLCPRAALRSVREGALAACLAAASSAVQCTQQDVQDPHVGTLAVRDGAGLTVPAACEISSCVDWVGAVASSEDGWCPFLPRLE